MRYGITLIVFMLGIASSYAGLPRAELVPGGVAVIPLNPATEPAPRVYFGADRVMVVKQDNTWHAVIGLPQQLAPGQHSLSVTDAQTERAVTFSIQDKKYGEQRITLKNKNLVDPSAEDLKRILHEQTEIRAMLARWSEMEMTPLPFDLPAIGRVSGVFGTRRFFNNEERQPHAGLDLAAARGTPALAPADGTVIGVGNYFFNGKTVFIDHGQGLISMFNHLDRIDVTTDAKVARGQRVGTIGSSGRATGPHLHWTVSLNNARVNPVLLLSDDALKRLAP